MLIKVKNELALAKALGLASYAKSVGKSKLLIRRLDGIDGSGLQSAASSLIDHLGKYSAVIFGGIPNQEIDNKLVFVAAFSPDLVSDGLHAGKLRRLPSSSLIRRGRYSERFSFSQSLRRDFVFGAFGSYLSTSQVFRHFCSSTFFGSARFFVNFVHHNFFSF